jgi:sarcosine oxidase
MRVTIIGAGIAGLSTAWALTKRGHQVTVLEQGEAIPNPLAASGDEHRMIRRAYGSAAGYARMISEAYEAWDEMWADLGASHYAPVGVLCISQRPGDEADQFRQGFDHAGTDYERLDPGAAASRYGFLDPAAFQYAIFTPEGGALYCQRIAAGVAGWLRQRGAVLRTGARVERLDPASGVVTMAGGERLAADQIVVAAGAWVLKLAPELANTLTTYRTAVVYLDPPLDLAPAWATAPAILSVGGDTEGYALPPGDGTGLKFGAGVHKRITTDASRDRISEPGEGETIRDLFQPPFARIAEYRVKSVVTCAYTFTADERFFASSLGRVLVVSACSGHGYKFGAAVGRRAAEAVESRDVPAFGRWLKAEAA